MPSATLAAAFYRAIFLKGIPNTHSPPCSSSDGQYFTINRCVIEKATVKGLH
jgi:hypothetical protein